MLVIIESPQYLESAPPPPNNRDKGRLGWLLQLQLLELPGAHLHKLRQAPHFKMPTKLEEWSKEFHVYCELQPFRSTEPQKAPIRLAPECAKSVKFQRKGCFLSCLHVSQESDMKNQEWCKLSGAVKRNLQSTKPRHVFLAWCISPKAASKTLQHAA